MRTLALDWGSKRVGVAMSDEGETMAFPLAEPIATSQALSEIKTIVAEYGVGRILLGLPKTVDGREGRSAQVAKKFAAVLTAQTGLPVAMIDERFTSVEAAKLLSTQGLSAKQQRIIKDNIAAQIMLQHYLKRNVQVP